MLDWAAVTSAVNAKLLGVTMGVLPDGTIYTVETVPSVPEENVLISTSNTGHRRIGE